MKKILFMFVFVILTVHANAFLHGDVKISYDSYKVLREIHKDFIANIEKESEGKWEGPNHPQSYTEAFIENKLQKEVYNEYKQYKKDVEEFKSLYKSDFERRYSEVQKELEREKAAKKYYWIIIIILFAVVLLLSWPIIAGFFVPVKKGNGKIHSDKIDCCPRCGGAIDASSKKCSKCGTHI